MKTHVIETTLYGKTRTYDIEGPQFTTVLNFWSWLEETGVIESYTIWHGDDK